MADYKLFYSWQSDESRARNLVDKILKNVVKDLDSRGVTVDILQDSRGQSGAQNISIGILDSINKADFFLADLTPVTQYDTDEGIKLCPNSNAIFEYGYAIKSLGETHCTQFVFLKNGQTMKAMPFDINQRKTLLINEADLEVTQEANSKGKQERNTKQAEIILKNWILDCIEEINNARLNTVPEQCANITFGDGSNDLIIQPLFKRINYIPKASVREKGSQSTSVDTILKGSLGPDYLQSLLASTVPFSRIKPVIVKPINKTIYESRIPIVLQFNNVGSTAIENIYVSVSLSENNTAKLYEENIKSALPHIIAKPVVGSISVDSTHKEFNLYLKILNPDSNYTFDTFFLLPPFEEVEFEIFWTIKSKTYSNSGILNIKSHPRYEDSWVESNEKAGSTDFGEITTNE